MAGNGKAKSASPGKDERGRFVKGHPYGPPKGTTRNPAGGRAVIAAQLRRDMFAAEIRRQLEEQEGLLPELVASALRVALSRRPQDKALSLRAIEWLANRTDGLPSQRVEHEGQLTVLEELVLDASGRAAERMTAARVAGALPVANTDVEIDPDAL